MSTIQEIRRNQVLGRYGMDMPEMDMGMTMMPPMDIGVQEPDMGIGGPSYQGPPSPSIQAPQAPPPPTAPSIQEQMAREKALMDTLFTPENQANEMFMNTLRNQPQLNNPGWARRLAASGAAAGAGEKGPDVADRFMYAPYMRDVAAWKESIQPQQQAANLERQNNINERQMAGQIMQSANVSERNRIAQNKVESDTKIANDKSMLNWYKTQHPDWKFDAHGPTVIAFDPASGQPVNTGISTGNMSEMEKIILETKGKVEVANVQGQTARDVATTRAGATVDAANARSGRAEDVMKNRNMILQQTWDEHPEWQKWIDPPATANASWQLKPPPTMGRWMTRNSVEDAEIAEYNALRAFLDLPPIPTRGGTSAPEAPKATPGPIGGSRSAPAGTTPPIAGSNQPPKPPPPKKYEQAPSLFGSGGGWVPATTAPEQEEWVSVTTPGDLFSHKEKKSEVERKAREKQGPPAPVKQGAEERARQFLKDNKQPATPENIKHVIEQGWIGDPNK